MKIYCHSAILLKNKINHSNLFQFRKRMEYPLIFLKKYIYLFENEKQKKKKKVYYEKFYWINWFTKRNVNINFNLSRRIIDLLFYFVLISSNYSTFNQKKKIKDKFYYLFQISFIFLLFYCFYFSKICKQKIFTSFDHPSFKKIKWKTVRRNFRPWITVKFISQKCSIIENFDQSVKIYPLIITSLFQAISNLHSLKR